MATSRFKQHSSQRQAGFTYLGLLFLMAFVGIAMAATGEVWHTVSQREKEQRLLFIGDQFRQAITRYYEHSPGATKQYPQTLDDLLLDKRYVAVERYLRKVYLDPMTGKAQWDVLKIPGKGIIGVRSFSQEQPLKTANFDVADANFSDKKHYSEWVFSYLEGGGVGQAASTGIASSQAGSIADFNNPAANAATNDATTSTSLSSAPDTAPSPQSSQNQIPPDCIAMQARDVWVCQKVGQSAGAARGAACVATAQSRYSACVSSGQEPLGLP